MLSARAYNLDPESAKGANSGGNRINESGKYIGTFTRAEGIASKKGTEGIEFTFETHEGLSADFLTLWTYNADGEALPSLKMLNAIMTCLKVKSIAPQKMVIEKYDPQTRGKQKFEGMGYPILLQKSIGLLLQKEAYTKNNGDEGYKFNIYGCFEWDSGRTAGEIIDQKPASQLERIVASLKDKPASNYSPVPTGSTTAGNGFENFENDIPY